MKHLPERCCVRIYFYFLLSSSAAFEDSPINYNEENYRLWSYDDIFEQNGSYKFVCCIYFSNCLVLKCGQIFMTKLALVLLGQFILNTNMVTVNTISDENSDVFVCLHGFLVISFFSTIFFSLFFSFDQVDTKNLTDICVLTQKKSEIVKKKTQRKCVCVLIGLV